MTEERGGAPKGLGATMARLREKWGIEQGPDTVPERWGPCVRCGRYVDEPAGEGCKDTLGWHGRKVVPVFDRYVLEKPGVNPNCPTCRGLGWLRPALNEPGDRPEPVACPECLGPHLRGEQARRMWEGIPRTLRELTLATFAEVGGDAEALAAVQRWLRAGDPDIPWLVLWGPRGTGKTGLAVGVCHALNIERGLRPVFATVTDMLTRLRATNRPDAEEAESELLASLKHADVLVFDDLAAQRRTDYAEEKLFEVINHRYNEALPTVFTTNTDPNDLVDTSDQMGRIVDRMAQRACFVNLVAPNLRQVRAGGRA